MRYAKAEPGSEVVMVVQQTRHWGRWRRRVQKRRCDGITSDAAPLDDLLDLERRPWPKDHVG